jgi:hypothetical protein
MEDFHARETSPALEPAATCWAARHKARATTEGSHARANSHPQAVSQGPAHGRIVAAMGRAVRTRADVVRIPQRHPITLAP